MARNAAIAELIQAEAAADLWSARVLGIPVWGLERLHQYRGRLLAGGAGAPAVTERRTNPLSNLAGRAATSVRELAAGTPARRRGRDLWVLSASNYRRRDDSGEYQCALAEHLRAELGERLLFLERNHAALPFQGREDVLFLDAAFLCAEAAGRLLGPLVARTPLGGDAHRPGSPASPALLCRDGVYARLMLALGRRFVREARPSAVFVLNGYHLFIPFQMAVREAGIPLIELQHGIIHESHPGYMLEGAPELPYLPDHIVVFGRHFGELLERESPRWRGRWSVGGHPWLRMRSQGLDQVPERDLDSVVVFSQPIAPVRERLLRLVPELRAKLPPGLRLILKPHPHEIDAATTYARALVPGVELASSRDDTYSLLRRCRLSVAVYSTVAMEALAFRCRSALLQDDLWVEDLRVLVEQGALASARNADDLAALAREPLPAAGSGDLADRYFGVRTPPLDFGALVERLRATRAGARGSG